MRYTGMRYACMAKIKLTFASVVQTAVATLGRQRHCMGTQLAADTRAVLTEAAARATTTTKEMERIREDGAILSVGDRKREEK